LKGPTDALEAATKIQVKRAEEHAREAARRDGLAHQRDVTAAERDHAADRLDRELSELERSMAAESVSAQDVLGHLVRLRDQAASDRAAAADDRRLAADDRSKAAEERSEAVEALQRAHLDELTGAHRRGFGEELLRAEIERARRTGQPLVLAIVDGDGLKQVNDSDGHFAGDQLLRDVGTAIRSKIRSYEPVVRLGGDEFAFVVGGMDRAEAGERCEEMRADLASRPTSGSFTIGFAELNPEDDLRELLRRADSELVGARSKRRRFARGSRPS
jgi:diguanylate cyclase (GGDEF)-like protein